MNDKDKKKYCMPDKDEFLKTVIAAYNMTVNTYQRGQQVPLVDNCFAFMFTNIGDAPAYVNGMVIFPAAVPGTTLGDSRSIGGHWLNLYKGNITLSFGPGANPNVEIVQLYYAFPYSFNK